MCKFILRNSEIMELYNLTTPSAAYRRKRAILDALGKSKQKNLTTIDVAKYENIDYHEFMEKIMKKPQKH